MTNFTECAAKLLANPSAYTQWRWNGSVRLIDKNETTQISHEGCRAICGTGIAWYLWSESSATITTWLLPIVGMFLQAPFESNAFWSTVLAIARWIGNPMTSLSYIFWNISVSGKCALMVDMAVEYDHKFLSEDSDFAHIRDSFYILMTMNQFAMKTEVSSLKKEAEGLLRIVLFSKDLVLHGTQESLKDYRHNLAKDLRRRRKRGVVPVFVSTAWFLFSLAISIQSAFGLIGNNAEAHDLALGLLLGWMPIMIMAGIVDRNPFSVDDVRKPLNKLISLVCDSLQDDALITTFLTTLEASDEETEQMRRRVYRIKAEAGYLQNDFFAQFAGQGRARWHYGCAHSILSDIENIWVADRGREWLRDEYEARTKLVLGSNDHGLFWFDFRELWQASAAFIAVLASCLGAFVLSYFTPTVGLGCRSLGYLIFLCVSTGLLILEFVVWWLTSEERAEQLLNMERRPTLIERAHMEQQAEQAATVFRGVWRRVQSWGIAHRSKVEEFLSDHVSAIWSQCYPEPKRVDKREKRRTKIHRFFERTHGYSTRQWLHRLFFVPAELFNTIWLIYIVLAQTFGAYSNCNCVTSRYGFHGGYVDLGQANTTDNKFVQYYWAGGTSLSCAILGLGLIYVVTEWCLQSHISTETVKNARRGLRKTRWFRRITYWPRRLTRKTTVSINNLFAALHSVPKESRQKTLFWSKDVTFDYATDHFLSPRAERQASNATHEEELHDWTTPPIQPTPTFYRDRSDTGASLTQHLLSPPGADNLLSPERSPSFVSGVSSMDPTEVGGSDDDGERWRPGYERAGSSGGH
ncbi:hypothetical protein EG327_010873 [Venturia inaequalis]|uniref:Uncharacterized protein n=1 Tax=Venturia inaequalis TaxID=5025 RepID=A0A8H3UG81_VENIN|nr:hypothetical protein EG327_010873 [Venturia inaequalis]